MSLIPSLAATVVSKTAVMQWLLKRIQGGKHDENRSYAAELLSILLQTNVDSKLALAKYDGVETLLKVLSVRSLVLILTPLLTLPNSSSESVIPSTPTRRNLWKMYLTLYVRHSANVR